MVDDSKRPMIHISSESLVVASLRHAHDISFALLALQSHRHLFVRQLEHFSVLVILLLDVDKCTVCRSHCEIALLLSRHDSVLSAIEIIEVFEILEGVFVRLLKHLILLQTLIHLWIIRPIGVSA